MMESLRSALGSMKAAKAESQSVLLLDNVNANKTAAPLIADNRSQKITIAGFEVEGVSIAGQETCIIIPRCKVAFDSGRCPQRVIFQQTLLLTHGHMDHIGGIPFHVTSRNMYGLSPSKLVVPPAYEDGIRRLLTIHNELQGERMPMQYDLLPLAVGQELMLSGGFVARPFVTTHTIASQGYLLYSQRKKLRAELQGLPQEEIRRLRQAGEEVTETFEVPEIAFTGDTTAAFLEAEAHEAAATVPVAVDAGKADDGDAPTRLPVSTGGAGDVEDGAAAAGMLLGDGLPMATAAAVEVTNISSSQNHSLLSDVLRARLLIMELTFLDDSVSVEQAREKGHMHIADFVANAHRFQNEAIMLVHFSERYSRQQIVDALNMWLPPALRARCVPLLNGFT